MMWDDAMSRIINIKNNKESLYTWNAEYKKSFFKNIYDIPTRKCLKKCSVLEMQ